MRVPGPRPTWLARNIGLRGVPLRLHPHSDPRAVSNHTITEYVTLFFFFFFFNKISAKRVGNKRFEERPRPAHPDGPAAIPSAEWLIVYTRTRVKQNRLGTNCGRRRSLFSFSTARARRHRKNGQFMEYHIHNISIISSAPDVPPHLSGLIYVHPPVPRSQPFPPPSPIRFRSHPCWADSYVPGE